MPLDRFVLMLVAAIAAAGLTVWVVAWAGATLLMPGLGALVAVPALLAGYVLFRVIADRVRSREDDRYDGMDG